MPASRDFTPDENERILRLRDRDGASWGSIAASIGCARATLRDQYVRLKGSLAGMEKPMLYLSQGDEDWIDTELKSDRLNGRPGARSRNDVEREAKIRMISRAIENVEDDNVRDILESIMDLIL